MVFFFGKINHFNQKQILTVIDKENPPVRMDALLPPFGQGPQIVIGLPIDQRNSRLIGHGTGSACTRIHPRRSSFVMIDKKEAPVRRHLNGPSWRQTLGQRVHIIRRIARRR